MANEVNEVKAMTNKDAKELRIQEEIAENIAYVTGEGREALESNLFHQLRSGLRMYSDHINDGCENQCDEISDEFCTRLAHDSVWGENAKLREMFAHHPHYNRHVDAVVLDGEREYAPNKEVVRNLYWQIVGAAMRDAYATNNDEKRVDIHNACSFFTAYDGEESEESIAAIERLAPRVYHKGKKKSKILLGLCKALKVTDDSKGSEWNRLYAAITNEWSRKLKYRLYISTNPVFQMTMSNPHDDVRGETMVSCHSLNSGNDYRGGCAGYARDGVSFIAFTAAREDSEGLCTRKTLRQMFFYKPSNGLLIQSRLYKCGAVADDSYGGCRGEHPEQKMLREAVERVIADCEGQPNLWRAFKLYGNDQGVRIGSGCGFIGYPDWKYEDFNAYAAIRKDKEGEWENFAVGTYGLCWYCGGVADSDILCDKCKNEGCDECDECGSLYDECDMYTVYNQYGDEVQVCQYCLDNHYTYCEDCEEYHYNDNMTWVGSVDRYVCDDCLNENYEYCDECEEYYPNDRMNTAYNRHGNEVRVCDDCLDNYEECAECGDYHEVLHQCYKEGDEIYVCEDCRDQHYTECAMCGEYYHDEEIEFDLCPNCRDNGGLFDNVEEVKENAEDAIA